VHAAWESHPFRDTDGKSLSVPAATYVLLPTVRRRDLKGIVEGVRELRELHAMFRSRHNARVPARTPQCRWGPRVHRSSLVGRHYRAAWNRRAAPARSFRLNSAPGAFCLVRATRAPLPWTKGRRGIPASRHGQSARTRSALWRLLAWLAAPTASRRSPRENFQPAGSSTVSASPLPFATHTRVCVCTHTLPARLLGTVAGARQPLPGRPPSVPVGCS